MKYVFDVDGTLTPSRSKIDSNFQEFFLKFIKESETYLVSGSDYEKTVEQLGEEICLSVTGVFSCAGNHYMKNGKQVYQTFFELSEEELKTLDSILKESKFPIKTGSHIEKRIGLYNFSIVGRNCTREQRKEYVKWDLETNERVKIANRLNESFSKIECTIAGETGIDIYGKGRNKAQIVNTIGNDIIFFGDRCEPGGNDHAISLVAEKTFKVNDWKDTHRILLNYFIESSSIKNLNYWQMV